MRRLVWTAAVALLASCGGGGGGGGGTDVADPNLFNLADATTVLGVDTGGDGGDSGGDAGVGGAAGDGSPLGNATVILTDSQGKSLTGSTDAKGAYLLRFKSADFRPPFVLRVVDAGGNVLASATELAIPAGKATRANINPLTDKVVSDVLPASVGGTDKNVTGAAVNSAALGTAKAALLTSVQGALGVAGVTNTTGFDPVRSVYRYDGTGVDAVIESISHARDPVSGATQLRAKLAPLVTNADGTVVPTLITAATPLAASQVAVASNPALTFGKIDAWIRRFNQCLAISPQETPECSDAAFLKLISPDYLHSSRDFDEDFRTLCSESDRACIGKSELRNPGILFIGRYPGSTTDDLAVVEVTIRQPRTGPLAGNLSQPVEYTKNLVFKRDDSTPGLLAGNWILHGNQRKYDWSVEPRYFSTRQLNPARNVNAAGGDPSFMKSGLQMSFGTAVFDRSSRQFVSANIRAVRVTGPGLPASGIVLLPSAGNPAVLAIANKTGVVPASAATTPAAQTDFRISGVMLPSGEPLSVSQWPGAPANASAQNHATHADAPTSDMSRLQAFSAYTAEFFIGTSGTPVVETARIVSAVQSAATVANLPRHDLTPSEPLVTPPRAAGPVTVQWVRNPAGPRITNAFAVYFQNGILFNPGVGVPDGQAVTPSSTSATIPQSIPAMTAADYREVGLSSRTSRQSVVDSIRRSP